MFARLLFLRDGEIAGCSPTAEKYYRKSISRSLRRQIPFLCGDFYDRRQKNSPFPARYSITSEYAFQQLIALC